MSLVFDLVLLCLFIGFALGAAIDRDADKFVLWCAMIVAHSAHMRIDILRKKLEDR